MLLAKVSAMDGGHHGRAFCRIAALLVLVCLCSCSGNLFGPESREIAGGYRLKQSGHAGQFALIIPNRNGGLIIDEIGWSEPLIVARTTGSQYWEVINTAHAQHFSVSDGQRKTDPIYRVIPVRSAEIAWSKLSPDKRLW